MILRAGLETGYQSILELVNAAIPSHHLDPIRKTVLQVKGVEGCRHIRGRRVGSYLYLDVKIQVTGLSRTYLITLTYNMDFLLSLFQLLSEKYISKSPDEFVSRNEFILL